MATDENIPGKRVAGFGLHPEIWPFYRALGQGMARSWRGAFTRIPQSLDATTGVPEMTDWIDIERDRLFREADQRAADRRAASLKLADDFRAIEAIDRMLTRFDLWVQREPEPSKAGGWFVFAAALFAGFTFLAVILAPEQAYQFLEY